MKTQIRAHPLTTQPTSSTSFLKTFTDLLKDKVKELEGMLDKVTPDRDQALLVAAIIEKRRCLRELLKLFEEAS